MAVQETINTLVSETAEAVTVMAGATIMINGISERITAAVAAAVANGATAEQLVPLTTLASDLDSSANALSAAVVANTPATPPPPPLEGQRRR